VAETRVARQGGAPTCTRVEQVAAARHEGENLMGKTMVWLDSCTVQAAAHDLENTPLPPGWGKLNISRYDLGGKYGKREEKRGGGEIMKA
jgi:hypothetical protein